MITGDFSYNNKRAQEFLNELSPKAVPYNGAWRRLESMGFQPDWDDADHGEGPKE